MKHALGYLLELRVRARGNPEGLAFIDRALAILTTARSAEPEEIAILEAQIERLGRDLALRYGAPKSAQTH